MPLLTAVLLHIAVGLGFYGLHLTGLFSFNTDTPVETVVVMWDVKPSEAIIEPTDRKPIPAPPSKPEPEPKPEPVPEPEPEPVIEPEPEPVREPIAQPTPKPIEKPTPKPIEKPKQVVEKKPRTQPAPVSLRPEPLKAAPAAKTTPSAATPHQMRQGFIKPIYPAYLQNPPPSYPRAARRLKQEGVVELRVWVTTKGRVRNLRIHKSSGHPVLDQAAQKAVTKWRFVPAKTNGVAVEGDVIVPIRFRLREKGS